MKVICSNIPELVNVFNHNTKLFDCSIGQINRKLRRLEKRSRYNAWFSFIFGVVIGLCFMEQNQKMAVLDDKIHELKAEIEELKGMEGD